jgi:hypothetical protein
MHIQGTDQYTVWNTDSNGSFVSNGTGGVVVSGSNHAITSLELSFNQDLNGDGVISTSSTSVASAGLVQAANNTLNWQSDAGLAQGSPIPLAQNADRTEIAAGAKASPDVSIHGPDFGGEEVSGVLSAILSGRGFGNQDSFTFRTDRLPTHADVPSWEVPAGLQIDAIVHEHVQVVAAGTTDPHSNFIGAAPDALQGHLADLLLGHFVIQ